MAPWQTEPGSHDDYLTWLEQHDDYEPTVDDTVTILRRAAATMASAGWHHDPTPCPLTIFHLVMAFPQYATACRTPADWRDLAARYNALFPDDS